MSKVLIEPFASFVANRVADFELKIFFHFLLPVTSLAIVLLISSIAAAQGGNFTIYGDLKVDETKATGLKPITFEVTLQSQRLTTMGRQSVPKNGRYRFENLSSGIYYVVVTLEGSEVANVRVRLNGVVGTDIRQDITLEWRSETKGNGEKGGVVSASAHYTRTAANQTLFTKAQEATKKKDYDTAKSLLQRIVQSDEKDFEAWTELGTNEFLLKNNKQAEEAYAKALEDEPSFILALLNFGKLRLAQKNYDAAIEVLSKAVTLKPPSAEANYFLGEAYLNIKKGSKAVDYMHEALRIEPLAKAEIHLRIAAIYDSVGLKDLAAVEYEQFLTKRPEYSDRKKLEKYIKENKKP
jgi:Tfp pilus assembly protein PilF